MAHLNYLQDTIRFSPGKSARTPDRQTLVFFLPGNPGFVEYYRNFLEEVHENLQHAGVTVYGASHLGFEMHSSKSGTRHNPPYSLNEVIDGVKNKLVIEAGRIQKDSGTPEPVQVVLMGHSVGAYMLLEIMAWWRNHRKTSEQDKDFLRITGGVCLFPTIVDIAKSPRGKVMSYLLALPFLPVLAQLAACLLSLIPLGIWNWARTLTPGPDPLPHDTAVTEAVIKINRGLSARQAAFMAHDEMLSIKEDKWHPAHIWADQSEAAAEDDLKPARLFFYWGGDDYWVDNDVRDRVIGMRARREGEERTREWAEMRIDSHEMDHCFSLNQEHAKIVAKEAAGWIDGIL
ncbi:hypothetical protein DOTSEDRAFT_80719 [Dothistroma septosporum NZE10]|uniref:Lipid droplet-associated hydrolase n=1 Tax=Dothistroma septosporum (strain NZE10 / CBS 128990) TaxID=675120 RepID=M2YMT8_DOTSN|nr:hypothetical protein DOTSEDRAFT_80719 [Dothistroma septosporum NZE10]